MTKSGEGYILRNTNIHLIQVADFIDPPPVFIVAVGAVTTTDEEVRSFKLTAGNYVTKVSTLYDVIQSYTNVYGADWNSGLSVEMYL